MFGDEGGRPADHHFRSLHLQGVDVGDGYAGVGDVPDDDHFQAFDRTVAAAQGIGIQQGLRGVFVRAVAGVDDLGGYVFRQEYARSGIGVAHDDHVDLHRQDVVDRVDQGFAFGDGGHGGRKIDHVGREAFFRQFKGGAGAGAVLEKEIGDRDTVERGDFLDGAGKHFGESFRRAEDQFQVVLFRYLIPNRWSTLRLSIGSMSYFSLVCVM